MKNLIIVGAGGLGREVLQMCMEINKAENRWNIKGFIDDNLDALNGLECKYSVIGTIKDWQPAADEVFVLAIADPYIKEKIVKSLVDRGAIFESVIDPNVRVYDSTRIGYGCIVGFGVCLPVNGVIGNGVLLNGYITVGHDCVIGDYSSIMTGTGVSGCCTVGRKVNIGGHAFIIPGRQIGDEAKIAAGSIVMTNVKAGTTVLGNPAKRIKFLENV